MLTGEKRERLKKETRRIMNIFPFQTWQISSGKRKERGEKSCKKIRVVNTQNYDKFSLFHVESKRKCKSKITRGIFESLKNLRVLNFQVNLQNNQSDE